VIKFNSTEIGASGRKTFGIKGIALNDNDEVMAALPYRNTPHESHASGRHTAV
jgi:hypothetical protein